MRRSPPPKNLYLPKIIKDLRWSQSDLKTQNKALQTTELVFASGADRFFTGDLHMAQIENPSDELMHFTCAIVDQRPLLQKRQALQASAAELLRRNEELQVSLNRLSAIINLSPDAIICADQTGATTIFARDITERKKNEAQRNRLESQLRESQKMQAVGTMAGGIAHDFNNIISAILGNAELALQEVDIASAAQVSLKEIDKAGRRTKDLVRQIPTFSRHESTQRTPIQLANVIEETVNLLKVTVPPTIQMQVHIDPSTPFVLADETQVEQALLNLCTNAIQAIGNQRGTISMGQGTGLGLSVVHGVMRTHEGTVGVQSEPGNGSVFTLCFPISTELPLAAGARALIYKPNDVEEMCATLQRLLEPEPSCPPRL